MLLYRDAANVAGRVLRNIPELYRQSLREAVWATWPLQEVSPEAIVDANLRSGCEDLRILIANEYIKIYVDFLQEVSMLTFTEIQANFILTHAFGNGYHIEFVDMLAVIGNPYGR